MQPGSPLTQAALAQAAVKQGLLSCLQKEQNRSTLRKVRCWDVHPGGCSQLSGLPLGLQRCCASSTGLVLGDHLPPLHQNCGLLHAGREPRVEWYTAVSP